MLGANDQRRFTEAVGLVEGLRVERSVDRAIASLESILRNARESGPVNALLARALLSKSQLARRPALVEQALVYARRGVQRGPDDPESHTTLGKVLCASGQYADAEASFYRALKLRPDDAEATAGLADSLAGQGRASDADAMYRKALALRPDSAATHLRYGVFCYLKKTNGYEQAVALFRKAIELAPESAHAYANLGGALQALNRHDEALIAYRKSLEIAPTAAGWSNLGTLQFILSRYDEARGSFRRAADLAPGDPLMWANLGDACLAAKDAACGAGAWPRANSAARAALEINPSDALIRSILASSLVKNGDAEAAQREIARALESDPTNPDVLYQAAVIATLRGNADGALSWLERAIEAGYPPVAAQRDPVLAPLRKLPAFNPAVKSVA
jgi:Flp pilus assembly protein TadD